MLAEGSDPWVFCGGFYRRNSRISDELVRYSCQRCGALGKDEKICRCSRRYAKIDVDVFNDKLRTLVMRNGHLGYTRSEDGREVSWTWAGYAYAVNYAHDANSSELPDFEQSARNLWNRYVLENLTGVTHAS